MTGSDHEGHSRNSKFEIPPWDAVAVTRQRADRSRAQRDAAIRELRESISEEQIIVEFGIDLGQLEG